MLLAILYRDGVILGAALACDQQPFGSCYWKDIHQAHINVEYGETAYVEITDDRLAQRLLSMDFENGGEAAQAVDDYLGLCIAADPPIYVVHVIDRT